MSSANKQFERATRNDNESRAEENIPIVVHQMGKVGSTSIEKSLTHHLPDTPIFKIHYLNKENVKNIGPPPNYNEVLRVWSYLENPHFKNRLKVITFTRDPISRNISGFFENIHHFCPWYQPACERGEDIDITRLINVFIEKYPHDVPLVWFDIELKPVFGIDVMKKPFAPSVGYRVYKGDRADILLIRCEDISKIGGKAISDFLGLKDFEIVSSNISSKKNYSSTYDLFKSKIVLPRGYVEKLLQSPYSRLFYSKQERLKFACRWQSS